ncbi:MAG: zf-HC2 domain-containing protein [Planctomycetota bacterium]|jgi:anti-sigma factor RsiW
MECKKALENLMGYLDGELDDDTRSLVQTHLEGCAECRREEQAYRRLNEMTDSIEFVEPTEAEWQAHWRQIYNRMERGVGWFLLSTGGLLLVLYGAYRLLEDFLLDSAYSLILRLGVGAATAGGLVLAVSVVRERIRLYRVDRYEEVEL